MEQPSQSSAKTKQRMNLQFPVRPKNPLTPSSAAAASAVTTAGPSSTLIRTDTPKGTGSKLTPINSVHRATEHSFLTDVADVRQMEQGLLQLLEDFHLGKLQAFGQDCTFEKMDEVRERQERLARLHFELDGQHDSKTNQASDTGQADTKNISQLMDNLQELCQSIQNLQNDHMSGPGQQ